MISRVDTGLQTVRARIAAAAAAAGRDAASIELVAVSKTFPAAAVVEAVRCGQCAFGENYAQEGVAKMLAVRELLADNAQGLTWHFIGPIQSNKTRLIAEHFDWVQSVDRISVAQRLSAQRPAHLPALQLCIQVNISGETTKHGVEPDGLITLVREIRALPRLRVRGLMAIPAPNAEPGRVRSELHALRELMGAMNRAGVDADTLSMGMSDDLEDAIAEGATMVRIGRAIFGARPTQRMQQPLR
jgi:PLP dependent protein